MFLNILCKNMHTKEDVGIAFHRELYYNYIEKLTIEYLGTLNP